MKLSKVRPPLRFVTLLALAGCSRFGAVYPPRPVAAPGPPVADAAPARLFVHVSVTAEALRAALDGVVPRTGEGAFSFLGAPRRYTWARRPLGLRFSQGRLVLAVHVDARLALPLETVEFPFDLDVAAEPVVNRDYAVKLQSVEVKVSCGDRRLELANAVAGVFAALGRDVSGQLERFAYDLRPPVEEAYARVARPVRFPAGGAEGCARVRVLDVEAGPTVIADGLDKDLAFVVAPSVTFPCGADEVSGPLPILSNVAAVSPGPFAISIPVAASYDELARAMNVAFTDGKLSFSKDYPGLFLANPELYESQGLVVLKLHLAGPVHAMGIDTELDGDIFFSGHVAVADNELSVPDLEPTIETRSLLLSLKAATSGANIRDQARAALRLDLGDRLRQVRTSLEGDLTFGGKDACFRGNIDKLEVASVHAHGTYLRVYVTVTGRASVTMPCASLSPASGG